jgi:DNA-directed RNA polymerase subunit RPC12/RpoP
MQTYFYAPEFGLVKSLDNVSELILSQFEFTEISQEVYDALIIDGVVLNDLQEETSTINCTYCGIGEVVSLQCDYCGECE